MSINKKLERERGEDEVTPENETSYANTKK